MTFCVCFYAFSRTAISAKFEVMVLCMVIPCVHGVCLIIFAGWLWLWLVWAGGPRALRAACVLARQLNLKWGQVCLVPGPYMQSVPQQHSWSSRGCFWAILGLSAQRVPSIVSGAEVRDGPGGQGFSCSRHPGKTAETELGAGWGSMCGRHPGRTAEAEVVAVWGVLGSLGRGCPGGADGAKVGYRLGGPAVLSTGGTLAGQLKLKWCQSSVGLGFFMQRVPWQTFSYSWNKVPAVVSWGLGALAGQLALKLAWAGLFGDFCTGGVLAEWLEQRQAWARDSWGTLCRRHPCGVAGSEADIGWEVLGCSAPGSL